MTTEPEISLKKKKKKSKKSKTISFDEEIVTKECAEEILTKSEYLRAKNNEDNGEKLANVAENSNSRKHKRGKRKKNKLAEEQIDEETKMEVDLPTQNDEVVEDLPKKKKRNKINLEESEKSVAANSSGEQKKTISIREIKRQRYAKLLEEKKLKTELSLQQKSLNYLSKWKHSKSEWKFEKLRQIWLQQNMFDSDKIPEEFWETLLEYLGNSKGKSKDVIIKDALKIVEKTAQISDDKDEDEFSIQLKRARDIIQHLQE